MERHLPAGLMWTMSSGPIYRPIPRMQIAQYRDGAGCLEWWWDSADFAEHRDQRQPKEGNALESFLRLHDADGRPERILAFAQTYGVLGICQHAQGLGDPDIFPWGRGDAECEICEAQVLAGELWQEPVEAWLWHAKQLLAIISIAFDLEDGVAIDSEQWEILPWSNRELGEWYPEGTTLRVKPWRALQFFVNSWLLLSPPQVCLVGDATEASFEKHVLGPTLISRLGIELGNWLSTPLESYRCSFCHLPYRVEPSPEAQVRRPWRSRQRKNYCPECRADDYLQVRAARKREAYARSHPEVKRRRKSRG